MNQDLFPFQITLGRTGLVTAKNGFGALPIQRISTAEAEKLLRMAYDGGITFFDTARNYSDSEEKVGTAFPPALRDKVILATKTGAKNAADFQRDLDLSLRKLNTDRIDLYQFHNPPFVPKPEDGTGLYEAMLEARRAGKIRFIGLTNHRRALAEEAIRSGRYDTIQFPLSYLSDAGDAALPELAEQHQVGFLAMKALAGGLIRDGHVAFAWMQEHRNVLPLWGVQSEEELNVFLECAKNPPRLDADMRRVIAKDCKELAGDFCRGCGYCLPCPAGIEINNCARVSLLLRRAPLAMHLSATWQEKMAKVPGCLHCGKCKSRCPYHLDTPKLLEKNYADYLTFLPKES
ncbi:MAG: aldo/keto reductase [Victivallaceae bacterium]|nr:aldo/keto reductase [Victivallaceae bacterium]